MPSGSEHRSPPSATRRDKRDATASSGSSMSMKTGDPSSSSDTRGRHTSGGSLGDLIERIDSKDEGTSPACSRRASFAHSTPDAIPQEPLLRDPELWFDDGNLVLVAGQVQFCVYKGLLTSQSAVFRDMLSLPQPSDGGSGGHVATSIAIVHLSDSPEDLRHLLRAFTSGMLRNDPAFNEVSACIRLGHKYQCESVVQSYVGYLKKYYVDSFSAWWDVTTFDPPGFKPIHRIGTVNLARLTGTDSLLPVALMACCKLGLEIGDGFTREDGTHETLSYEDLVRCFVGKAKVMEAGFVAVHRTFRDTVSNGCKHPSTCKAVLQRLLQQVIENEELMDDIRSIHFDDSKTGYIDTVDSSRTLCAKCYEMVGESGRQDEQRREIFRKLPEMMGVQVENWDASEDSDEEDEKSDSDSAGTP